MRVVHRNYCCEFFACTNFCGFNFRGDMFLWVRAAHRNYCCQFFTCTNFRGLNFCAFNFGGVTCLWKLVPNKNSCVYGMCGRCIWRWQWCLSTLQAQLKETERPPGLRDTGVSFIQALVRRIKRLINLKADMTAMLQSWMGPIRIFHATACYRLRDAVVLPEVTPSWTLISKKCDCVHCVYIPHVVIAT